MFKKDRLRGLTGADVLIAMSDGAARAGAPHGVECMNIAMDLAINDMWLRLQGVPAYQQTAMRILMGSIEQARQSRSQQAMVEVAMYGAMMMTRVSELAQSED